MSEKQNVWLFISNDQCIDVKYSWFKAYPGQVGSIARCLHSTGCYQNQKYNLESIKHKFIATKTSKLQKRETATLKEKEDYVQQTHSGARLSPSHPLTRSRPNSPKHSISMLPTHAPT